MRWSYSQLLHQPFQLAAGDIKALTTHLVPDLAHPVDFEVLIPDVLHLAAQNLVKFGAIRGTNRITLDGFVLVEGRRAIGRTRQIGLTPYSAR